MSLSCAKHKMARLERFLRASKIYVLTFYEHSWLGVKLNQKHVFNEIIRSSTMFEPPKSRPHPITGHCILFSAQGKKNRSISGGQVPIKCSDLNR